MTHIPAGSRPDIAAILIERVDGTKERHPMPSDTDIVFNVGDKMGVELKPHPATESHAFAITIPIVIG